MPRSSTSSSEPGFSAAPARCSASCTLQGLPRPGKAFALTVALCVVIRIGFALFADRLERIPSQGCYDRFVALERQLVREPRAQPRVLVLGNSVARYAVDETLLARELGVPRGQVVNLGVENGRPYEAMQYLLRNRQLLNSTEIVVYVLELGQLDVFGRINTLDRLYHLADPVERLRADRWRDRLAMLGDWLWPCHSQRRGPLVWLDALGGQTHYPSNITELRPGWSPKRLATAGRAQDAAGASVDVTSCRWKGRHPSASTMRHLRELVTLLRGRGIDVVMVSGPLQPQYREAFVKDPILSASLRRHEEMMREFGLSCVVLHDDRVVRAAGLTEPGDFLDENHLTPQGATKLTRFLAFRLTLAMRERHGVMQASVRP